jgi:hypothetical protein
MVVARQAGAAWAWAVARSVAKGLTTIAGDRSDSARALKATAPKAVRAAPPSPVVDDALLSFEPAII